MPSDSLRRRAAPAAWLAHVAALAVALLAFGPARAAPEAEAGDELATLLALPVHGGSRLAAASKYEQDATEAPSLVYVRTGGEIRAQGYRTLAEVLESMPGIHLRQDRTYAYTGVRGIERPGDYSSRLLLLLDGVRINEAIYDSATAGAEFPLDVGLIDRVEFIPGPGSALYGSNALLGVVNVVTRSPAQLPGAALGLDVGSLGRRKLSATWGGDLGQARVLFGLASEHNRGHATLYYPEYDSPDSNRGRAVGRDGERNDKLYGKARWGDLGLAMLLSDRRKDDPTGGYGVLFDTRSESTDRFASADLSFSRRLDATHEVFARLGVAGYEYRGFGIYGTLQQPQPSVTDATARWVSGESRYVWSGWSGHRVLLGVEFQNNWRQHFYAADLEPAPYVYTDDQVQSTRWSLFVNDEWELMRALRLNVGVRADRQLNGDRSVTPRLAALYALSPQWTLKLQGGSAFREPNVSETSYQDSSQAAGGALEAESLRSAELAVLWRPSRQFDASLSTYRLELRDTIDFVELPDGQQIYANTGRQHTHGIEVEATWQWSERLRLRGSWARQDARDRESDQPLSDAPRSVAKLMLTAAGPWPGTTLGLNLLRLGERRTIAGARLAPYTRLNAQFMLAPVGERWSAALGAYNLGGERYADPAGPEHRQDSLQQDGRVWRVQLGWSF
ncbi:TonB-dependent receptor [Variovorax sp. YR752]|uniref:TonB-dependent receptor plug domain-containing protein n=1 Tax=Variovorax sp. YR752 TaxID=1884383 RepID=UPI003137D105